MSTHTQIHESDGLLSLTFHCGELPADEAIGASGHEPNGYFWEGLLQFLDPTLADRVELDSEAGMFCAQGERDVLEQVDSLLGPYLEDGERVAASIREAEAAGFEFDD